MCGRYTLAGPDPSQVRERFALGPEVEVRRRWNVAPQDDVVAVRTDRDGRRRGDLLRWGLVPFWAEDPRVGARMINARAETVAEKPAFRDALRGRRCLIAADGFYEWQPRPDRPRKQPFHITRTDGAPFAFAGIWASWRPKGAADEVEPLRTCSIITTAANARIADIHDRMPVILLPQDEAAWLDTDAEVGDVLPLLRPLPDGLTARREVGYAVNDARHDAPDCLDPPQPEPQGALFD
ncbi:SOS response-associated peptidase [Paraconexibacter sp.]|uniref:SOS response-associated peptidase n=1 Tax=Paraconexibacter sp. TaxID=2949640 RepID=UPI0035666BD4